MLLFSKHVLRHDNGRKLMFKFFLIGINVALCVISISLMSIHYGFEQGYEEGSKLTNIFVSGGATAYGWLANVYFLLTICYFFYLIGHFIKNTFWSEIFCFSSLLIMFFPFYLVYRQKSVYLQDTINLDDVESFSRLLRKTIILDWFCFFLVLTLLFYQISNIWSFLFRKSQKTL